MSIDDLKPSGLGGMGNLQKDVPDVSKVGGDHTFQPSLKLKKLGTDADAETEEHDPTILRMQGLPPDAQVHRVVAEEAMSRPYHYRVSVVLPVGSPILEDYEASLVGHRATINFAHMGQRREVQGIVSGAAIEGMFDDHEVSISVEVVPELALLGLRVHSRIFQEKSAVDVVREVFEEWGLEFEIQLEGEYPVREYVTQYQESDLAFVERLLASEGIAYFFMPGRNKERIVVIDAPAGYAPVPSKGGSAILSWSATDNKSAEYMVRVRAERRLRPTASRIGDFDYRKPGLVLRNLSLAEDEPAGFVRQFGAEQLSVYRHGDTVETSGRSKLDGDERRARVALAQHRGDVEVLFGATRARRLLPGHVFTLSRHPVDRLNQKWAITKLSVRLTRPRRQNGDVGPEEYEAQYECVPADVLLRPAVPERRVRQVSETATVTGPRGEAVFPDEHGRIKVKFHWDLSARDDDTASCWLHVAQGWVGANWGSQFVPRVGTEVVVTFLGGDPDRPLVTGCVYNGTHPPPFPLPSELTKSGLRTRSFPGGEGYNELSFDDRTGSERVHVRAERDLSVVAQHDQTVEVGRDRIIEVKRDLKETVEGAQSLRVVGGQVVLVEKDSDVQIGGDAVTSITGAHDVRVSGSRTTRIEGKDRADLEEASTTNYHADQLVRVLGHQVTVVGDADAQRSSSLHVEGTASSYSTGLTEIASETVLVLRCGESSIRMTPKTIEIFAPNVHLQGDHLAGLFDEQVNLHAEKRVNLSAERVHLAGKAAAVDLLENARIDGKQVKLNCTPEPEPEGEKDPPKPTRILLADEEGAPLGHQRFVVVYADGSQRSGVTGDDGEANVLLDASGQVFFPDVDDARKE